MNNEQLRQILKTYKNLCVIGLSPNEQKPSFSVTQYMQYQGYQITGVNPDTKEILGRPCFSRLAEVLPPIEIINVFRRPEFIPAIVDEIASLIKKEPQFQPKVLWLQLGIEHAEAEAKVRNLGLEVVSNKCILVEHRRLI